MSGDQIKINLQLIHGRSNVHLWSEEYTKEWKSDEIFELQSEVVEGIAANMNAVIAQDELAEIRKKLQKVRMLIRIIFRENSKK